MRILEGGELVIATHNAGKAAEIAALLKPWISKFYTAADLNLPEPEETGATFAKNAVLKARAAAQASGKPALADDSGLAVNALDGDPGIYSARWGGLEKNFDLAMRKVHEALGDMEDRSASFICVLALAWPDGHAETFESAVHGEIIWPPRGKKGFGYDPVFQPCGYDITFAEMNPAEKQAISHRARAFDMLVRDCLIPHTEHAGY